ncbi:endonuclease/exonuclease/phosphatase family protein [Rhizoctonia solani AG-3 Rhs1AP]|uniref:Endonuclease/exonuclease/phosphatase family protein n=1 Tax=Rhizoctonia solani AG-3 Rhs1AP TaxID=1086054 RepID=X8IYX3_9AGAM|nr:endonuclease/exonuclease/phosphatase family protein [Rhizoctonia solani AG-3 Rhs1AP]
MRRQLTSLLAAGLLYLAIPARPNELAVASSGTFNVLTLIIPDSPVRPKLSGRLDNDRDMDKNTIYIGMRITLNNYGIVNVQGNSNYQATLYRYDLHPFRTPSSDSHSFASGLNTLSNYRWVDFSRNKWNLCSDRCHTQQGFTFMRVRIEEGVYIDMINLDTSAGVKPRDETARRSNIQQVSQFIKYNSAGNAVVVFGNTNSLYTRSKDNIRLFKTENGLADVWVESIGRGAPAAGTTPLTCPKGIPKNFGCEDVDKVLYRGSRVIRIDSYRFYYDTSRFLSPVEKPLTDRNPVRAEFAWSLKGGLSQSDLWGGSHGTWFNDLVDLPPFPQATSFTLRGANRLDGLTMNLTSGQSFKHGGSGGTESTLSLASGEYIISVKLCWGVKNRHTRNFYAQASTNKGNVVQAGRTTDNCATAVAPKGYGVVGTYGQAAKEMDQLGFIYAQQ